MRIRTIKPEFWTHPVLGRQPPDVQLMAIGLLNLADDAGYFLADPGLVRSALFPFADSSKTAASSLKALEKAGWIQIRCHETHGPIGLVVNFTKHQVINRPAPSKLSEYFEKSSFTEDSRNDHGVLTESSLLEGKGKEGNREGKGREQGVSPDVDVMRSKWNELGKPFAKWIEGRNKDAADALRRRPLEQWLEVFQRVAASDFCRGSTGWVADIDWVLRKAGKKPETATKVLEGAYDNRVTTSSTRAPVASEAIDWTKQATGEIDPYTGLPLEAAS